MLFRASPEEINVVGVAEKVSRLVKIWQEVLKAHPAAKYVCNYSQNYHPETQILN